MNGERIRLGLAGLCATALLLVAWLLVKPEDKPGLGESYARWDLASTLQGFALIVGVVSLCVLALGLMRKPPPD